MPPTGPTLPHDASQPRPLSPGIRTAVTLLLFTHFFMLAVGVLGSGTSSSLEQSLYRARVLAPYRQLLNMNLSYAFNLTYADETDTDYFFEVDVKLADGTEKKITLPEASMRPQVRRRRYQRLAGTFARLDQQEGQDVATRLVQGIAKSLLQENKAGGGTLLCRQHFLQTRDAVTSADKSQSNPMDPSYYRTVYEAKLLMSGGQLSLLKKEEASDAAPAATGQ